MPKAPAPSAPRLTPEHAELVVLSVLAEGSSYGYAITKAVAATSDGAFAIGPAKLYPLLTKLEQRGLVTTTWEEVKAETAEADAKGRRRKWYRLSAKGKRRHEQAVEAHRRFTALIENFIGGDFGRAPEASA
jgi:PadR family transcriptional regulator PadR